MRVQKFINLASERESAATKIVNAFLQLNLRYSSNAIIVKRIDTYGTYECDISSIQREAKGNVYELRILSSEAANETYINLIINDKNVLKRISKWTSDFFLLKHYFARRRRVY